MARIIAPNKEYAGVSAGVPFSGGEGHTDNKYLISWFKSHGYEVIEEHGADDVPAVPAQKRSRKKEG